MMQHEQQNIIEFTVSEISQAIKHTIENAYPYIKVKGELTNFKRAPSGHLYMTLKDSDASLAAICWKGTATKLAFQPEDGLEVSCTGRITTYAGQSKYQLIIDNMSPAGIGALMALLEKRKQKLALEGLFDPNKKQPIPFLPKTIGIITSPTGAVIQDILHRIKDRCPTHIIIWPTLVQGDQASTQIVNAINGFNSINSKSTTPRPNLLIIARGGGSLEDLWTFNEEAVIRAIAQSQIPIISAIGHETDTTLSDYAADLRAPTPTAAAEHAVPVLNELFQLVQNLNNRLKTSINRSISIHKDNLTNLIRCLPKPTQILNDKTQQLDNLTIRFANAFPQIITTRQQKLHFLTKLLNSYHYQRILERGYAIIRNEKNQLITSAKQIKQTEQLHLEFHDSKQTIIAQKKSKQKPQETQPNPKQECLF